MCLADIECTSGLCYENQCLDADADDDGDGLTNAIERSLGTKATASDTDGDGKTDGTEVGPDPSAPLDVDGDGRIDAIESATSDADGDCIKDELDADDKTPTTDMELVKQKGCRTSGVCAPFAEAITATCEAGVLACDYTGAPDYEGATETACDGADGDCDGQTDEDFVLNGSPIGGECRAGPNCGRGIVQCALDSKGVVCSSTEAGDGGVEICDGEDNDCDGDVDEDVLLEGVPVGGPCVGIGACGGAPGVVECNLTLGEPVCSVGANGSTSLAGEETCNGQDDDCDGDVDEGIAWSAPDGASLAKGASCGGGACAGGVVVCNPSNSKATCSTLMLAVPEVCDGIDNDCDGAVDEDITFLGTPLGAPCEGLGECALGVVECAPTGGLATCSTHANGSASEAAIEICDDLDNDCDGLVDDALLYEGVPLGGPCQGRGACGGGIVECVPGGVPTCSSNPDGSEAKGAPETCDGLDNDCDGETDEDLTGTADDCGALGVCAAAATASCIYGAWLCEPPASAPYEAYDEATCDGLDNDCDGDTDEGLPMVFAEALEPLESPEGPAPDGRWGASVACDEEVGEVYVYGGRTSDNGSALSDTWRLDLATNDWTLVSTPDGAPAVSGGAVAWDPAKARLFLVAGTKLTEEEAPSGAVWVLEPAKGTWKSLGVLPGAKPPAVEGPTLTLDPTSGALIRMGGRTTDGEAGGAWRLDPSALAWEPLPGGTSGGALLRDHSAAWDAQSGQLVVAGGLGPNDEPSPLVQTFDPSSGEWAIVATLADEGDPWRPTLTIDSASRLAFVGEGQALAIIDLTGTTAPSIEAHDDAALPGAAAIYDTDRRRAVLFGGRADDGTPSAALRALPSICE